MSENPEDDWLHPTVVDCANCGLRLFRVDHSPLLDDFRLYCDSCPRAVEISFYDRTLMAIQKRLAANCGRLQLMAAIEPLLQPCACGGHFHDDAPRRCVRCNDPVISDDPAGVDLSPYIGCEDEEREPTPVEQQQFDTFQREFVRTESQWI